MEMKRPEIYVKLAVLTTFTLMISVNAMANALPINGVTTGEISDFYPNLFTPAGFTFSIWGLIYLLLAGHTLYQLGLFKRGNNSPSPQILNKIGVVFSVSSIANAAWIFAWHYYMVLLSLILIITILVCLIFIDRLLSKENLTGKDKFFVRLPFSIYFGWITVATIANVTVLLVSMDWNGFGVPEQVWTALIVVVGMIIGISVMNKNKDVAYGLVIVWAYSGILIKHISADGFSRQYPMVISAVVFCIIVLLVFEGYILFLKRK